MSDDLDEAIDEAVEAVHEIGDDTGRFSLAESADFYEAVARAVTAAAQAIREEARGRGTAT